VGAIEQHLPDGYESKLLIAARLLKEIAEAAGQNGSAAAVLQFKLADCASAILEELEARRRNGKVPLDPVTGLAVRERAEEAIVQAFQSEAAACVAVVAIDRLSTLNLRFGNTIGDEILRDFASMLRQNLSPADQVFRWNSSALVVVRPRAARIELVRREFGRLLDIRYERTVETPSRAVHLPIMPRWAVWPMMASPPLLMQKIDSFATMANVAENQPISAGQVSELPVDTRSARPGAA
jgi:diguanylate cyclase (GGDEF)-like protein